MIHIPVREFEAVLDKTTGANGEPVCFQNDSGETLAMLSSTTRTIGILSGHDHSNSYYGPVSGVPLIYGRKSGFGGYSPADGHRGGRIFEFDLTNRHFKHREVYGEDMDIFPGDPCAQGRWASIQSGHTLIKMHDGRVLDWVVSDGTWRLWNYDPSSTADIFPGDPVAQGRWASIQFGHTLIKMHDGHVLDWVTSDGTWRLWNYDPFSTADIFPGDPCAQERWASIQSGHTLIKMHNGRVLDWAVSDGTWRLWNFAV